MPKPSELLPLGTTAPGECSGFLRLRSKIQQYDWGVVGKGSLVGQLGRAGGALARIDDYDPYAELWVGIHPNGPSTLYVEDGQGRSLADHLRDFPQQLSSDPAEQAAGLSFLLKLLSVGKALSIQAHPSKERAEVLFRTQPSVYKDPNHKPEMAYCVTEFEALVGFDRVDTICQRLSDTPELEGLVGEDGGQAGAEAVALMRAAAACDTDALQRAALKSFFSVLMRSSPAHVAARFKALYKRLLAREYEEVAAKPIHELDNLALRLHEQFPDDVGIFCAYVLCYRKVPAGQALFLAANEPHAYLSGSCIEIMANSDNVVRAGLTPKFKDVQELESMLTYAQAPLPGAAAPGGRHHPSVPLTGEVRDKFTSVFAPPDDQVDDFQLERVQRDDSHVRCRLPPSRYGSLVFVLEGQGEAKWNQGQERTPLFRGTCFFQPANTMVSVSGAITLFRATKKGAVQVFSDGE